MDTDMHLRSVGISGLRRWDRIALCTDETVAGTLMKTTIALVHSLQDEAGINIHDHVMELLPAVRRDDVEWVHHAVEGRLIFEEHLNLPADRIIFLSRHRSEKPVPILTVHVTGNFHEGAFGGQVGSLPPADPGWMQAVLRNLTAYAPVDFRVSYEVTHHGPTELERPSFFVEIGSTIAEWKDPRAGAAVASAVLRARPKDPIPLIGLGGTHYAARETAIALQTRGAFGHIAHTREVARLDTALIRAMRDRSGALAAYIDRKAVSAGELRTLRRMLEAEKIPEIGEGELQLLGDLDFSTFLAMRGQVQAIVPGSVVHPHNMAGSSTVSEVHIPADLFLEAVRCDGKEVARYVTSLSCAHITGSDGKMLPVFLAFEEQKAVLINHLITFCVKLINGCADTAVEGDRLIIRRTQFDPRKARDLGIPREQLGRLAAGQAIELKGRIITPAMVHTGSVKEIFIPGLARYL
jgi:D-aminoacyl-tRNA deacylase